MNLSPVPHKRLRAPIDGSGLYLGYQSLQVVVQASGSCVDFCYVTEPPHGDALLEMRWQQHIFPGLIWGSTTYWSPDGRYLMADWAGPPRSPLQRVCVLIDLQAWRYVALNGFRPTFVDAVGFHGKAVAGQVPIVRPDQPIDWQPVL